MADKDLTEEELYSLLIDQHGCKKVGKPIPVCYASEDDYPDYFETPTKLFFSVPQAIRGIYPKELVHAILSSAKLNVVVPMKKGGDLPTT